MEVILERFNVVLRSLEDIHNVLHMKNDTKRQLSISTTYHLKVLFNQGVVLRIKYDPVNRLYTVTSNSDTKLYRIARPTKQRVYHPVYGEGVTPSEAFIDFIKKFLRPFNRKYVNIRVISFIIFNKISMETSVFEYDPELFLILKNE